MSDVETIHGDRCCNPYNKKSHKGNNLRYLSKNLKVTFPRVATNAKICSNCRKIKISYSDDNKEHEVSESLLDNEGDLEMVSVPNSGDNERLSPDNLINHKSIRETDLEEMLNELKELFHSLSTKDPQRLSILTIAPESWSAFKIASEFKCSWGLAQQSKQLRSSKGILAITEPQSGRRLPEETIRIVTDFYTNDANSRIMPGKKDNISVQTPEGRCMRQKRLLLMDLRGLHLTFKEDHPDISIGFSKFAQLRPKHCVLAGSSGTHSVCVCIIHQNFKLLLEATDIITLTCNSEKTICNYKDCLKEITCKNPTEMCYLHECDRCPDVDDFLQLIGQSMEDYNIHQVQFSGWTGTDKSTLVTQILHTADFLDEFKEKLLLLKPHSFIAKMQSNFFEDKKKNLSKREVFVILDFSENYKYVVQEASQAFHFNNSQCTVFPVVFYYIKNSELHHKSLVFLSDSTRHDTAAVYTVQRMLIPHIMEHIHAKKIIYCSDGAKQHFKNKFQMINLINHETDFGVQAEWHCHATAHGKGASDGVGALFKREAARSSLLCKPSGAILTLDKLLSWGQRHFDTITTLSNTKAEHLRITRSLRARFDQAPSVPEIQKSHSFTIPQKGTLLIKRYSNASSGTELHYV